jgi:hypothetical protein
MRVLIYLKSRQVPACGIQQSSHSVCHIIRVGQNHIYTVYIRYFWQGNLQKYSHIRCIYTVLANPTYHDKHRGQTGKECPCLHACTHLHTYTHTLHKLHTLHYIPYIPYIHYTFMHTFTHIHTCKVPIKLSGVNPNASMHKRFLHRLAQWQQPF